MTYFDIIPEDLILIILSKLGKSDILEVLDIFPSADYRILLRYRYPEVCRQLENIIDVNKRLKFKNFKKYLPLNWRMIYIDILTLEFNEWPYHYDTKQYTPYPEHMTSKINSITGDMLSLIPIYIERPLFYKYLDVYLNYSFGIEYIDGIIGDLFRYDTLTKRSNGTSLISFLKTGIIEPPLLFVNFDADAVDWIEHKIILNVMYIILNNGLEDMIKVSTEFMTLFLTAFSFRSDSDIQLPWVYEEYLRYEGIYYDIIDYLHKNNMRLPRIQT